MKKASLLAKLKKDGFASEIVSAFREVDRRKFVLPDSQPFAYDDVAMPIGHGQTISQPYTIAYMLDLLEVKKGQKILEVGSGSGYALGLLNELTAGGELFGVEIVPELLIRSRINLAGLKNISILPASNRLGLLSEAPFSRILVSAAAKEIPEELLDQLGDKGIIVCPVKDSIVKICKSNINPGYKIERHEGFRFVPLVYR